MADIHINGKNEGDGIRLSFSRAAVVVIFLVAGGAAFGSLKSEQGETRRVVAAQSQAIDRLSDRVEQLTTAVEVLKVAPPRTDSQGRILKGG